jgi:hypothetical protein
MLRRTQQAGRSQPAVSPPLSVLALFSSKEKRKKKEEGVNPNLTCRKNVGKGCP